MATSRTRVTLGNALSALIDHRGRTPKKLGGDFSPEGVPVVSAKNIIDGRVVLDEDLRYVDAEMYRRWMPQKLRGGDVILTSEAPLGEVAYLKHDVDICLGQRLFALRTDPDQLESRYLYYLLRSKSVRHQLHARGTGTTAQGIRQSELVKVVLEIPPLSEQRAIAHVLGTLDAKIELNRRMNEALEAIARAIFKAWFVDFGPVRAKAEGREPMGMDAATAALYPDSFEESTLGKVPKGWSVEKMSDLVELAYGKGLKEADRRNGSIPVYGSNGQVGWHDEPLVEGPGIVVGRKGNPGVVTWVHSSFFPIDTTFYVVPRGARTHLHYLYYALSYLDLPNLGADSAVPGLNRNIAYMSTVLAPPVGVLDAFARFRDPLVARMRANHEESRTLAAIRDTLLPKLISGEIRVKDVAKHTEANL